MYNVDVNFSDWLNEEMSKNEWSQSDLARKAGLTRGAVNHLLSGRTKTPDNETIEKLAHAFDLSPESVMRYANILPISQEQDPWVTEMSHKLSQLPPDLRGIA